MVMQSLFPELVSICSQKNPKVFNITNFFAGVFGPFQAPSTSTTPPRASPLSMSPVAHRNGGPTAEEERGLGPAVYVAVHPLGIRMPSRKLTSARTEAAKTAGCS